MRRKKEEKKKDETEADGKSSLALWNYTVPPFHFASLGMLHSWFDR